MQEQILKLSVILLSSLLAGIIALGVFLVLGTQGGHTDAAIEAIYPEPKADLYSPDPLPVEDHLVNKGE